MKHIFERKWCSRYLISFVKEIRPPGEKRAQALVYHAMFNESGISRYMVDGVKYITSVRHPIAWFKSAVNFFHRSDKVSEDWRQSY